MLWVYGLHSNDPDEYVKKPMNQCSGEEILKEMLYWFGAGAKIGSNVPTCLRSMPFELPKMMDRMLNAINCYP